MRSNRACLVILLLAGCGSLDVPTASAPSAPRPDRASDAGFPDAHEMLAPTILAYGCDRDEPVTLEIARDGSPLWHCVALEGTTECELAPDTVEPSAVYELRIASPGFGQLTTSLSLRGGETAVELSPFCGGGAVFVRRVYRAPPGVRLERVASASGDLEWPRFELHNESPFVLVAGEPRDLQMNVAAIDVETGRRVRTGGFMCGLTAVQAPLAPGHSRTPYEDGPRPELRADRRYRYTVRFALEDPGAMERAPPAGLGLPPLAGGTDSRYDRDVFVVTHEHEGAELVPETEALELDHLVVPGEVRPFREGLERARGARRRPRRSRERE